MEIEPYSSFIKRALRIILIIELLIFIAAYLFCGDQPTWNRFFSNLFVISLLSLLINGIFYGAGTGAVLSNEILGYDFTRIRLEGSKEILGSAVIASFIGLILSIVIPLVFPK